MNHKRLEQLQELLKADPDDPFLHYGIAMEYLGNEDFGAALAGFEGILKQFPDYVPNYYQFGKLLFETGSGERSVEILRAGVEVARKAGDRHSQGELASLLDDIEDELDD